MQILKTYMYPMSDLIGAVIDIIYNNILYSKHLSNQITPCYKNNIESSLITYQILSLKLMYLDCPAYKDNNLHKGLHNPIFITRFNELIK